MSNESSDLTIISRDLTDKGSVVMMGFPGSGLVGSIALQYLVDQLEFSHIGDITSRFFPPMSMMQKGVIHAAVRIYEKEGFAALVADIPIHPAICYEVANGILDWLAEYDVKEIVTIAGIVTNEAEKRVFGVASDEEAVSKISDHTIILPMGSISGIASSLLTECKLRKIPCIGLLGETVNNPDPRAAVSAINVLNDLYSLNLDTAPLLEQAEEIEMTMQRLAEEVQGSDVPQQKKENLPMYG
ncbi:proteasome assembly chaperone family protein [Methanocalculus taiwanensis]|uniref:Proteasome assembly chaperone family protein n=1 Tax=Methanocalculus taiwanensis TaxID=106207 RepID=A0ABD4TGJ8_9EURY|nr:proteasome assembly chaperone family protein [Methanocalculus taiwanensis]MCQ1538084.1 proteasome assembly chaperone family protein [Methanocalculus taiwanensis]